MTSHHASIAKAGLVRRRVPDTPFEIQYRVLSWDPSAMELKANG
jgi:hypothetical protein